MADAEDLRSSDPKGRAGSSPALGTNSVSNSRAVDISPRPPGRALRLKNSRKPNRVIRSGSRGSGARRVMRGEEHVRQISGMERPRQIFFASLFEICVSRNRFNLPGPRVTPK